MPPSPLLILHLLPPHRGVRSGRYWLPHVTLPIRPFDGSCRLIGKMLVGHGTSFPTFRLIRGLSVPPCPTNILPTIQGQPSPMSVPFADRRHGLTCMTTDLSLQRGRDWLPAFRRLYIFICTPSSHWTPLLPTEKTDDVKEQKALNPLSP